MTDQFDSSDDPDRTLTMPTPKMDSAPSSRRGNPQRIDRYQLTQKIGEGGMGEVWEAEQVEPVHRRVALKLIKRGMDSDVVIARFESERQALALMNHSAIARVYDAGSTERGRPYFVMELVKGLPIKEYCDRHRLSIRDRLEIFIQVCDGIHHAHQKAIIHRDVKPSNILVTERGGHPQPKIIDFGIAKAISQRLTERTLYTELGQFIGTPEYMSPEQAEVTAEDIDIRTDVYSLGMVLYELLAGVLPFDPNELREAGLAELQRRIREDELPRPSLHVARRRETSTDTADKRRTTPPVLVKTLKGDLDWIVLKALEKDRNRRYESAHAFAQDIERFLANEPIEARPPSAAYKTRMFVRRHRVAVAATGLVVIALVLGILVATVGLVRAKRAEVKATQEATTARQVSAFLEGLFEVSDPSEARGNTVSAREILDQGSERIRRELVEQPIVQARLMQSMGRVYTNLGLFDEASPLLERSLEIRRLELGDQNPDTLASIADLADLLVQQGNYGEAEKLYTELLEARRRTLGNEHPDTLKSINDMGVALWSQDRLEEADQLFREALEGRRRTLGPQHRDTLDSIANMGFFLDVTGNLEEAEPFYREAIDGYRKRLGNDHPDTLAAINNMGVLLKTGGKLDEAERYYAEALAGRRRVLGDDHPDTLLSINNMGALLVAQGDLDAAEPFLREALDGKQRILGDEHNSTLISMGNLGVVYTKLGRHSEADELLASAVETARRALSSEHTTTAVLLRKYGACLAAQGRYDEAEESLLEARETLSATLGDGHQLTQQAVESLAALEEAMIQGDVE